MCVFVLSRNNLQSCTTWSDTFVCKLKAFYSVVSLDAEFCIVNIHYVDKYPSKTCKNVYFSISSSLLIHKLVIRLKHTHECSGGPSNKGRLTKNYWTGYLFYQSATKSTDISTTTILPIFCLSHFNLFNIGYFSCKYWSIKCQIFDKWRLEKQNQSIQPRQG